jgi:hypothetical protein
MPYKVVRRKQQYDPRTMTYSLSLASAIIGLGGQNKDFEVIYTPGEFVRPVVGGKLLCFDDLEYAKDWSEKCKSCDCTEVWHCEVENPEPSSYLLMLDDFKSFEMFWSGHLRKLGSHYCLTAPLGSLQCDAIKITEKVK